MMPADGETADLFDTHAHLADPDLSRDLDGVLARAHEAGVSQILAVGTTADDSETVVALAARRPEVLAAVGIHPNHWAEKRPDDWANIVSLAARLQRNGGSATGDCRIVAIGETGLDRYRDHTPFAAQQEAFDRHFALAFELHLPVVIHCRQSERDIIQQLERLGRPVSGILHSFTGTWDDAQAFLALGLHVSFAGMVTFTNKNLDHLRDTASRVPLDRVLIETDSPYLSPHPHRGQANEPARVRFTAERLAELRGMNLGDFARATSANARRLFLGAQGPEAPG
jgi:TatD DNase family protein